MNFSEQHPTSNTAPAARLRFARDLLLPFAASRLVLVLVGLLALQTLHNLPATAGAWNLEADGQIARAHVHLSTSFPLVNMWIRWDAGWYHSIARDGYQFVAGKQSNVAFFPAYPMLMRLAHSLSPSTSDASWFIAGIVVSNAAFIIGLFYFAQLVRVEVDDDTAARAVLYVVAFPTAFFFSAVYSESVSFAAIVGSFYYARKSRWLPAAAFGAVAALSRSPGILISVPLVVEYMAQRRFRWREIKPDILVLGLVPGAVAGLMLYHRWRFGNMFAIQEAQSGWGGGWGILSPPWEPFLRFFRQPFVAYDVINFSFTVVALVFTVLAALRLRASYGVYAVLYYWFVTAWGTFDSMPRYVLLMFPAFILLAIWGRNRAFDRVYLIVASGLAAFFMMRFALWRWVA